MNDATLRIGDVAAEVGIRTSAIRYYERVGVLPQPQRSAGQRRYTRETIRRLRMVEVGKRAGLSLGEIGTILATEDGGKPLGEQLRELAERKLREVDAQIEEAQRRRGWLALAAGCDCATIEACALFDAATASAASRQGPAPEAAGC